MKKTIKEPIKAPMKESMKECAPCRPKHPFHHHGGCGAVYGMGFIGALVYYISTATGFWNGVLGILKALVWPAFVVFGLMKHLGF